VSRVEWRVPRHVPLLKAAAAILFALVALRYAGDPGRWIVALLGAVLLGAYAVRDLVAPVRLAADFDGVTVVTGFARRRQIPWADIERVRVDTRQRLGRRNEVLEVDTGESLYLFGAQELGTDLDRVAGTLAAIRTGNPLPEA
jgi:hypothetical protein